MKRDRKFYRLILFALMLAVCGTGGSVHSKSPAKTILAPAFSLRDISGKTVTLSQFKGKVVILDFWATWCPPCREEIPHLVDFYNRYKGKGVVIVGVALDDEGLRVVKPFVEKHKINYPVVIADDAVQSAYGPIQGIPTKFIIDQNGNIVAKLIGYQEIQAIEKKVKRLLGK